MRSLFDIILIFILIPKKSKPHLYPDSGRSTLLKSNVTIVRTHAGIPSLRLDLGNDIILEIFMGSQLSGWVRDRCWQLQAHLLQCHLAGSSHVGFYHGLGTAAL